MSIIHVISGRKDLSPSRMLCPLLCNNATEGFSIARPASTNLKVEIPLYSVYAIPPSILYNATHQGLEESSFPVLSVRDSIQIIYTRN